MKILRNSLIKITTLEIFTLIFILNAQNILGFAQTADIKAKPSALLTEASKVSINGIGPIKVGMTIEQASRVSGTQLVQRESGGEPHCLYYEPQKGLSGVDFMVTEGRISRIDITNPKVTTLSGAKVGDSESRIKSIYPNKIQVEPHEYVPQGHYLIFVPKDPQDKNYRVLFETDGKKVTSWRAGKLPEVRWVERCA